METKKRNTKKITDHKNNDSSVGTNPENLREVGEGGEGVKGWGPCKGDHGGRFGRNWSVGALDTGAWVRKG
jgi:hypothetical protein